MARVRRSEIKTFTRERLRRAARGEFAARGVGAASVDRIAESAGYSRGAFYSNYLSKRELLVEIVAEDHEREIALWQDIIDQPGDLDEGLALIAERFDQYAGRREGWMLSAELQLEAERDPMFGATYRVHSERGLAMVADLLVALLTNSGASPSPDVRLSAVAMRSVCQNLMFAGTNGALSPGETPGDAIVRFLRSLIKARSPHQ